MEWRELRGVTTLCLAILFTDIAYSTTIPIFPFYSSILGASVQLIGILAATMGISTMLMSIPLGFLSDRIGRRKVMLLGITCFIAYPIIISLSTKPLHLFPAQVILGIARASTFSIGFIYTSELVSKDHRSIAQGLYMTSMGTGFTLGPLVGGLSTKTWGYDASFHISSGFAFCALIMLLLLPGVRGKGAGIPNRNGFFTGFWDVLRSPYLVFAGVANFFNSMLYSATMVYFPLYGRDIGLDESQVGLGLTVRGMLSTTTRLPTSMLVIRLGALRPMILGLSVLAFTIMMLPAFESLVFISIILGIQGIAYGVYFTSGNIFVAEEAQEGMKGAAIGTYSTFSNISGVISPILLGAISARWNIRTSFIVAAVLALVGLATALLYSKKRSQASHSMEPSFPPRSF